MKFLQLLILVVLSVGCDANHKSAISETTIDESAGHIGKFKIHNTEIREEILAELVKANIQHWANDDGSISYLLSDGEKIDSIGNDVILSYISRN